MAIIYRSKGFFRKTYRFLYGGGYLLLGIICFFFLEEMPYSIYVGAGLLMIVIGYFSLNRNREYIAWDEEKLVVRILDQKKLIYKPAEIDSVRISNNHLSIKSGAANGTLVDLEGYKEEDIQALKTGLEAGALSTAINFT